MKEIKLLIEDDVYRELETEVGVYAMCYGSGNTFNITFLTKLIDALQNNKKECHFQFKNKKG